MTDTFLDPKSAAGESTHNAAAAGLKTKQEPPVIVMAQGEGPAVFDLQSRMICAKQLPLPGVVIFVHGVNSEGEWFKGAESGLCEGLNRRLGRLSDQIDYPGVEGGQLTPADYTESWTPDGFLNPKLSPESYVKPSPSHSVVIPFRWGYRATLEELKEYGDKIFLNEKDYWGGGPFANGCSSLPDLWQEGVDDRIFGWITVQAMNPTTRPLFRTPPRAYGVLAALRLAKLIGSIRQMQADVPITVVCHSQGNMVGITAAFFGDKMEVQGKTVNSETVTVRCVADTYVLANPPYSLANTDGKGAEEVSTFMETWSQRGMKDQKGNRGRETYAARTKTLSRFLDIIRARAAYEMPADQIDKEMANKRESPTSKMSYSAQDDRNSWGLNKATYGRVTLYCCPHDQVISAVTVQGVGWRGISAAELADIGAAGVLTQRVFASGFLIGNLNAKYNYRTSDWRYKNGKTPGFWYPPSPPAKYGLTRAYSGNESILGTIATTFTAPVAYIATFFSSSFKAMRVNADPPEGWEVTCDAPQLPETFTPKTLRLGKPIETKDGDATSDFNDGNDPPAASRDASKADSDKRAGDPYDTYKPKSADGVAGGDQESETSQRYEDRAILRMEARRTKNSEWVDESGHVVGEDGQSEMSEGYQKWRNKEIKDILDRGTTNNPTNHSTTMNNPEHAKKALAYDVAIGLCHLTPDQLNALRIEADWRFGEALANENPSKKYSDYFAAGTIDKLALHKWVHAENSEGAMPADIADEREGQFYLKVGAFA
ncbi:DUF3274 domain-containing protein [Burkholderia stagnalis]|uniref:T6SS effector phospholipase Tle3 domain-containing protein n=1 Tax=Burkholderia stagnalis TaxID=1503054 RepID=UPI000B271BB6|nr:DUF3274 domain-containing protein [Burkholderia stagnalis]